MRTAPRSRRHRRSSMRLGVAVTAAALVGGLLVPAAGADRLDPIPGLGGQRDIGVGNFFGDGPEAALVANERAVVLFDPWPGLPTVAPVGSLPGDATGPLDLHRAHTVGDLDGDGLDDIIADSDLRQLSWWPGLDDRSFGAGRVLDFARVPDFTVGDFTADPGEEVLRVEDLGESPAVESTMRFHHPGRRGPVVWSSTDSPEIVWNRFTIRHVLAGDVTPGGRDEAIVIGLLTNDQRLTVGIRVIVFAERSDGWHPEVVRIWTPAEVDLEEATVGDVNGDGHADLILLNDVDVAELWVLAADGRGGFDEPVRVWAGPRDEEPETFVGAADINRDGLDDLVAISGDSPVRFFGSVTDLLVEDPPDVAPLRCAGRLVTVDLRFGDEPTDGDDVILGTDGPDVIRAGGGADTVCAGGGNDRVIGGPGSDRLVGGPGRDRLVGGSGRDRLIGGGGSDRLVGNRGRDVLRGGAGDDRLIGGPGRDRCAGGSGRDVTRSCP